MKEKIVEVKERKYICEVCGKTSDNKRVIWNCELRHKQENCKHENGFYYNCCLSGVNDVNIYKNCNDCDLDVECVCITFTEELCKKFFNEFKENK